MAINSASATMTSGAAAATQAPWLFVGAVFAVAVVIWKLLSWQYRAQIETLKSQIEMLKTRVDHFAVPDDDRRNIVETPPPPDDIEVSVESKPPVELHPEPVTQILPTVAATITLLDLMEQRSALTEVAAKASQSIYIGNYIEVSAPINDVYVSNGIMTVAVTIPGLTRTDSRLVFCEFADNKPSLLTAQRGDSVKLVGRIKYIGLGTANLDDCRLASDL